MTGKTLKHDEHPSACTDLRQRPVQCGGIEALEKSDIAELSVTTINKMTCDELVRMIRVTNLLSLLRPGLDEHLPFYDHAVLVRLAHLAQRCCSTQGTGSLGKAPNDAD